MKPIKLIAILAFIALSVSSEANAQQKKIPKNPFKFSDAVTGKPIPEVLVIPRYSSAKGIFIAPEGPAKAIYRTYLDKPFVYRTGNPFVLKRPKFIGLPLLPVFVGKATIIEGILIVAPKYRPVWFETLSQTRDILNTRDLRDLQLTPITDNEWSFLLAKTLKPLTTDSMLLIDDFRLWGFYEAERSLYVDYSKDECDLVIKFLQAAAN